MDALHEGNGTADGDARDELAVLARALAALAARGGPRRVPRPAPPAASHEPRTPPRAPRPGPAPAPGPVPEPPAAADVLVPAPPRPPADLPAPVGGPGPDASRSRAAACATLGALRTAVAACTACGLSETRTQTVFSDGPERARLMFVGEAPGQREDELGVPFVGAAGQLLTDIITKGMGLARGDVHIANVLKCRPPGNRDPSDEEKALCTPYLDRQIELVDPELIITLGLHATRHLLRSPLSMARLRGRVHAWNGRKVVATYHPAYLLRNPADKKECWKDIQLAMRELGLELPGTGRPAREEPPG